MTRPLALLLALLLLVTAAPVAGAPATPARQQPHDGR